jgi:CRP-like cAMP-binding protein
MAFPTAAIPNRLPLESLADALGPLTSANTSYAKGQILYELGDPAVSLFYVVDGRIKVSRPGRQQRRVLVDVYVAGEFFGESALLSGTRREQAVAMGRATVREWAASDVESFVNAHPGVGMSLLRNVVTRCGHFMARVETLSADKLQCRLARVLLRCAERFGTRLDDGNVQLPPLTHEVLSEWVGTSRELATHFMNKFRRAGLVRYSRREIVLSEASLGAWLDSQARTVDA